MPRPSAPPDRREGRRRVRAARVRWLGVALAKAIRPWVIAREFADDGWYRFSVRGGLPGVGLLIDYEGRVRFA